MEDLRSFFKVFMPSYSSESLRIPLAFVGHVKGRIPEKVFLRNRHGKLWPVKVTEAGNHLNFSDGWVKFAEDSSLEFGDFLVFDYDGTDVFHFKIFGRTGCEKEVIGSSHLTVNNEEQEEVEEEYLGVEEEEDDLEVEEEEGEYLEVEEAEDDLEVEESREENEYAVEEQELEATTLRSLLDLDGNKRKAAVKVEDDDDIFEYGMVARPKNPYFVAKLREKRQHELYVPVDVIKDHRLKLPENLILLDEEGREWSSKVHMWKDGRTWLGWRAFCKWNNLKSEDRCLCEFVHEEGRQEIYLKLNILREGSWLPKGENQTDLGQSS